MAINAILVRQNIASSDVVIPEDIKSIFANIVGTTTQKASNTIDGMLERFWAAFKQAPAEATVITGT